MTKKERYVFIIFTVLLSQAQNIKFNHLTVTDGLAHSVVSSIAQDGYGTIWIATGNGLSRYNGRTFTNFLPDRKHPDKSIPSYLVNAVNSDPWGNIWISTMKGCAYYDLKKDQITNLNYSSIPGITNNQNTGFISKMLVNSDSILYVLANGLLVVDLKQGTTKHYLQYQDSDSKEPLFFTDPVEDIFLGIGNTLYLSNRNGLYFVDKQGTPKPSKINANGSLFAKRQTYTFQKFGDRLLLQFNDFTLALYNPNSDELEWVVNIKDRIKNLPNGDIRIEKGITINDRVIFTLNEGYVLGNLSLNNLQYFKHNPYDRSSVGANSISALFADKSGILFFGTVKGGVSYSDMNSNYFTSYFNIPSDPKSLPFINLLALFEDTEGNFWIGTFNDGIIRKDAATGNFTKFNQNSKNQTGLSWLLGTCKFVQDRFNNLYVLNWTNGFYRVDFNRPKSLSAPFLRFNNMNDPTCSCVTLPQWASRDMIIDQKGIIWVVSFNQGIQKYNPEQKTCQFFAPDGKYPLNIAGQAAWCIAEDKYGNKWIGTDRKGVYRVNDDLSEVLNFSNNPYDTTTLPSDHIKSAYGDNMGNIWLGTGGAGLVKMNAKTGAILKIYSVDNGLSNNTIYTITQDANEQLWLTTDYGLNVLDPKTGSIRSYYSKDGLINDEYGFNSATKTQSGAIAVGGVNGYDIFNPSQIKESIAPAFPYIASLVVNNRTALAGSNSLGRVLLNQNLNSEPALRFTRKENSFTFSLASLHYSNPQKNKLRYMLEGYDDDWIEIDNRNADVTYSNLPGGTYIFKVRAANSHGHWGEDERKVTITIVPNFYERWEFYLILIVVTLAILYRFVKERERKSKEDKNRLEQEIKKATSEILIQNQELQTARIKEEEQRWIAENLGSLTEILTKSQEDVATTSNALLSKLIRQLGAASGLLVLHREQPDLHFEVIASYGPNAAIRQNPRIEIDEGIISACYQTGQLIIINDTPPEYLKVTSGLGEAMPAEIWLIPLKSEDVQIGVLELAFFSSVPDRVRTLLDKLKELIALNFHGKLLSERVQAYLEESKEANKNYQEQELVMRQFMEELTVKQETFERKEAEYVAEIESLKKNKTKK